MPRKIILCTAVLSSALLIPASLAAPAPDACAIPPDLRVAILKTNPHSRPVTIADLESDDQKFFRQDHGHDCPGLVRVDFYGDGKPTFALVLVSGEGKERQNQLVVAHKPRDQWEILRLDTGNDSYPPVVWKEKPGTYTDIERDKVIRSKRPVIVFCGYESWAILYAWTGTRVRKIWISD